MQSSSESVSRHINNQIRIALMKAEISQDKLFVLEKNQIELEMNKIESTEVYDKLENLRKSCLNLCKQAGLVPEDTLWFDFENYKLVFSWQFKVAHIKVSLHRFSDGTTYLDYKFRGGDCSKVLDDLNKQLVSRFYSRKLSVN